MSRDSSGLSRTSQMPAAWSRRDRASPLPFALAYNLANFLRTLALPEEVEHWSLMTLREKLIKIGARIVRHSRYVVFQLAEVAVPRALFAEILPDRPAPAETAAGMSWVAAMRGPGQRRCVHDQRRPAQTRPNAGRQPRDRFCTRSALLPMRKGLPAAPEGRRLDPHRPASGECRIEGRATRPGGQDHAANKFHSRPRAAYAPS